MIGLVLTKKAVTTVCGVEPLSPAKVWSIKLGMLAWANIDKILVTSGFAFVFSAARYAATHAPGDYMTAAFLTLGSTLLGLIYIGLFSMWSSPMMRSSWMADDYNDYYPYNMMPREAHRIAHEAFKAGFQPKVEYLLTDPFIFVEVNGQRVYLYHW